MQIATRKQIKAISNDDIKGHLVYCRAFSAAHTINDVLDAVANGKIPHYLRDSVVRQLQSLIEEIDEYAAQ